NLNSTSNQTTRNSQLKSKPTATIMPLFKSNKNKSSSVATTPAQTPRSSLQAARSKQTSQMTMEQALEAVQKNSLSGPVHLSFIC
ncbi:hypothetical protein BGZ76_004502, partial [Entomortierella beljakovae]